MGERKPIKEPSVVAVNISQLFNVSYNVPIYQRDYAWTSAQIDDLWEDLFEFFQDDDDQYLLGQIIVAPATDGKSTWDLVDGQQRLTSVALLIASIRSRLHGDSSTRALEIIGTLTDALYEGDATQAKLSVSIDARKSYFAILNNENLYQDKSVSGSNLVDNRNLLYQRIAESFPDTGSLMDFADRVLKRVWVMRVEMARDDQAIEFFERTNDRGLDLNSADLLKNLLFAEVGDKSLYKEIDSAWTLAAKTVRQIPVRRIASMEYLMKALVSARLGKHTSNKKVFRAWRQILKGQKTEVNKLIQSLPRDAQNLLNISSGQTPDLSQKDGLLSLSMNGIVQHYLVLLGASHIGTPQYLYLAQLVQARTLLSLLTRERNGDFERGLTPWARNLAELRSQASFQEIYEASRPSIDGVSNLLSTLEGQLRNLDYSRGTSDQNRIRTALAIASTALGKFHDGAQFKNEVDEYMSPKFDIEHVTAKSSKDKVTWGEPEDLEYINKLGNLTLFFKSDNRAAGDALPISKSGSYSKSEVLATKILCDLSQIGSLNPELHDYLVAMQLASDGRLQYWGPAAAEKRLALYVDLIRKFLHDALAQPRQS
jgi:hypothetical protein